jgi:xanthine dehydrogenase accessory factor
MIDAVLAEATALSERGVAFVLATVVWRRAPSSGQVGSKALIVADGTMHGWLGGACAQPTVRREALTSLDDGRMRLLLLGLPAEAAEAFGEGVVVVPMECGSEGALAISLEPVVPAPLVVAIGASPAVDTLAALARGLRWRAVVVESVEDLASQPVDPGTAVVVATQGHDDEVALQAALKTRAGYIGLVASRKRAAATLGYLRDRGVPDSDLSRVQAPAGLDLGSTDHREIAVAILAELVTRRARGELRHPVARVRPRPTAAAVDPVCGMSVEIATSRWHADHGGRRWYFCGPGCLHSFTANPAAFTDQSSSSSDSATSTTLAAGRHPVASVQ